MELRFVCTECRCEHQDPADARLGHLAICSDCAIALDFELAENQAEPTAGDALAA